jgi:probable HAF family extracellular repeat protein
MHRKWLGAVVGLLFVNAFVVGAGPARADTDDGHRVVGLAPQATSSAALAINAHGAVVGWSSGTGAPRATAWLCRSTIDVGIPAGGAESRATGISDLNKVVGNTSRPARPGEQGERVQHGFRWSPDDPVPESIPNNLATQQTTAAAVNEARTIAGTAATAAGFTAYQWKAGAAIDYLQPVTGLPNSDAEAINAAGDIAGYAYDNSGASRAVLWRDGAVVDVGSVVAPGRASQATDVSDTGDVVGTAEGADGSFHGFLWSSAGVLDLGPAGQYDSVKVNNRRQVVFGSSDEPLWQSGARVSLNALGPAAQGWYLYGASDINDAGRIVGTGNHNGRDEAYLLVPPGS